jgi:orotidine-5'-phosphate decarboxylase
MKIIVALDYKNPLDALQMVALLRDYVDGFKIGTALWSQSVYVKDYTKDKELFVDCKLWDTPGTVELVVSKIVAKGGTMATISTWNNDATFKAVEKYADKIKLLGVSYLTSWTPEEVYEIHGDKLGFTWEPHIKRMTDHGFGGIVCSVKDLGAINSIDSDHNLTRVCPGIIERLGAGPEWYGTNPQARTGTAVDAEKNGADYIVVGRAVTKADDPIQAIQKMRRDTSSKDPIEYPMDKFLEINNG